MQDYLGSARRLNLSITPWARSQALIQHPSPPPPHSSVSSAVSEVVSTPIPRNWGATPVAAELGWGTGSRCYSRQVAVAKFDLGGAPRSEECTSCTSGTFLLSLTKRCNMPITMTHRIRQRTGTWLGADMAKLTKAFRRPLPHRGEPSLWETWVLITCTFRGGLWALSTDEHSAV